MAKSLQPRQPAPMLEMNLTPLIDVLLVLLVMFIITIPLQSHAVKIDLPQRPPEALVVSPVKNKIDITSGDQILWNGLAVTKLELAYALDRTRQMQPEPELHLQPEAAARYELVDQVLAITQRAGVARMGFVGNEAYRRF